MSGLIFSSPDLLDVWRASSDLWHQQLLQRTSPKLLVGYGRNDPYICPSIIIVQCMSNGLKIDFRNENFKIFLSETTRPNWPNAFMFCM